MIHHFFFGPNLPDSRNCTSQEFIRKVKTIPNSKHGHKREPWWGETRKSNVGPIFPRQLSALVIIPFVLMKVSNGLHHFLNHVQRRMWEVTWKRTAAIKPKQKLCYLVKFIVFTLNAIYNPSVSLISRSFCLQFVSGIVFDDLLFGFFSRCVNVFGYGRILNCYCFAVVLLFYDFSYNCHDEGWVYKLIIIKIFKKNLFNVK